MTWTKKVKGKRLKHYKCDPYGNALSASGDKEFRKYHNFMQSLTLALALRGGIVADIEHCNPSELLQIETGICIDREWPSFQLHMCLTQIIFYRCPRGPASCPGNFSMSQVLLGDNYTSSTGQPYCKACWKLNEIHLRHRFFYHGKVHNCNVQHRLNIAWHQNAVAKKKMTTMMMVQMVVWM